MSTQGQKGDTHQYNLNEDLQQNFGGKNEEIYSLDYHQTHTLLVVLMVHALVIELSICTLLSLKGLMHTTKAAWLLVMG